MPLDPAVFRPEAIDEESKQLIEQLRAMAAAGDSGPRSPSAVLSENANTRSIPGPAGEVELRCFVPSKVDGAYLNIHGGGWVAGSARGNDARLETLSNGLNLAVLSVEYRLAPRFPYPAGPDDCEAAALWLAQNAQAEFGTDKLLIGGGSAGAHLAVVSLLRLRDRHALTPYCGADLAAGVYDASLTPSARNWGDQALVASTPMLKEFSDQFAPPEIQRVPDVSPLYADLHDMPKALFTVGSYDPLLDDSMFMYARWLAAGNEAELEVFPGGVHGLTQFPTALGRKAVARQEAFLKAAVAAGRER